jgi:hypothetical protein
MRPEKLLLLLFLIFSATNGFGIEKVFALDNYSGTYNIELLCAGHGVLTIQQWGSDVVFSIDGDGVCEGTGTVNGNSMSLSCEMELGGAATLVLNLTFADGGGSFTGTAEVTSAGRPPETFIVIGSTDDLDGHYDVESKGIPRFVGTDYIELDKIARISKFRSGEGHDYSDDFESCRSMKHYFLPKEDLDWSTVKVFAPVSGTICSLNDEGLPNSGKQVRIKSEEYPAFYFVIFHVNLSSNFVAGEIVSAGQLLGFHTGSVTSSDIAVGVFTPTGNKLVSYFDVMTDTLFRNYIRRGLKSRSDIIISKEERDANPLTCDEEVFTDSGTIENWMPLQQVKNMTMSPMMLLFDN